MTQLVRIADDVDRRDLAGFDLQGGGLQRVVVLDGDEAGQAVDVGVAHEARRLLGEDLGELGVKAHHVVDSDYWLRRRRLPAAAIRMDGYVRREQRPQASQVAAAACGEKGRGDAQAVLLRQGEA